MRALVALAAAAALGRLSAAEVQVRETVKAELKDPGSAQFKGVKQTNPGYWCGWVNAKNAYGGYTGFSVFYYHEGKVSLLPPELSEPKLC